MKKIFIDCGGHIGESIRLFKRSKEYDSSYKIYSFEPVSYLSKYYRHWKDIIFSNKVVWIYDGEIDFYLAEKSDGNTLFKGKYTGNIDKNHPIKVKCLDFSQWVLKTFDKDDYIILKMDIEGGEYQVLTKMILDGSIDYVNKLYIEWHSAFDNFPDRGLYKTLLKELKKHTKVYKEMRQIMNVQWKQLKNLMKKTLTEALCAKRKHDGK